MAAYLIVDAMLDKPDLYESYKLRVKPLVDEFGGEFLARGGNMFVKESDLWSPTRMVLIRFPDAETANRFYDSPQYQEVLAISKNSARRTAFVLEGL